MNRLSKKIGAYQLIVFIFLLASTVLRTVALFLDYNLQTGYFDSKACIIVGNAILITGIAVGLISALLFGGFLYGLIEVLYRGYTHPSMVLTGGVCFGMMLAVNRYCVRLPLVLRSGLCALGITAAEFLHVNNRF